jgi:hypothetical protein
LAIAIVAGTAAAQGPTFIPASIPLGNVLPATLHTADVSGDTYPDMIVCGKTNTGAGFVDVFVGDTLGGFLPALVTTPAAAVASAALGDFNGDGKLDLLLGLDFGTAPGAAAVYLGNGFGGFAAAGSFGLTGRPGALAVADVDGDGDLDAVAVDFLTPSSGSARLLLGDGLGGLSGGSALANANNQIALEDFDGDSIADLLIASDGSSNFKLFIGNGTGGFAAPIVVATTAVPDSLAIGDLNGDGKKDLVLTLLFQSGVRSFLGNGNGTFGSPITSGSTSGITRLALGDLNGDGNSDLGCCYGPSAIATFLGSGAGAFAAPTTYPTGFFPRGFSFFDIEKEGRLDMATVNLASPVLTTFTNYVAPVGLVPYGTGTPGCTGTETLTTNKTPVIGASDFQFRCDHTPLSTLGLGIVTTASNPAGFDPFGINILLHIDYFSATEIYLLDFFSSGAGNGVANAPLPWFPGLVGKTYYAQTIWVWSNPCSQVLPFGLSSSRGLQFTIQGPGASAQVDFQSAVSVPAGSAPDSVAIADLNNDAIADLVVANSGTSQGSVMLGSIGGAFAPPAAFATGADPQAVVAGDFNADGFLDVATADGGSNTVTALLGDGTGALPLSSAIPVGTTPMALALGDLDNDGRLDLVVSDSGSNDVAVLLGDGSGGFTAITPQAALAMPRGIALADLSADGKADLVVVCEGADSVSVAFGDGAGGFAAPTTYAVGSAPAGLAIGDANNDFKADVVVTNTASNSVSVLLGNGLGALGAAASHATGSFPAAVAVADANRDTYPDLLVVDRDSGTLSLLLGTAGGSLLPAIPLAAGASPVSLAFDFPAFDGRIRVVTANLAGGDVSVLKSN